MTILRCTKKLLSELTQKPENCDEKADVSGSWHANLMRVDRRKCILFTHDRTLFSFFVPGLTKPDFMRIQDVFGQNLFKNLLREELPQRQIEMFLDDARTVQLAATNNRSVLGSMNDLAFQIKFMIASNGGLAGTDIMQLNHDLNRIPMSAIAHIHSIAELNFFCQGLSR